MHSTANTRSKAPFGHSVRPVAGLARLRRPLDASAVGLCQVALADDGFLDDGFLLILQSETT